MSAPPPSPAFAPAPAPLFAPAPSVARAAPRVRFLFVGERLWLDFVNTEPGIPSGAARHAGVALADVADAPVHAGDALRDFETFVAWLESAAILDTERAQGIRRRAVQQPAGATATLIDARRVRAMLRLLA